MCSKGQEISTIGCFLMLLLSFANWNGATGKRDYVIEINHCNYTLHNPNLMSSSECSVFMHNSLSYLNAHFVLAQNITNFRMIISLDMLRKDNTKINLMHLDLNGCKFLEVANNQFLQVALRELHRVSNLPKFCPIWAGVQYVIANYTLNPEDYPPFTPAMSCIMCVEGWIGNKHQVSLTIKGRVHKKV